VIPARETRWMKFDLYVNTDFWNMTWLPRDARRVHLFHGVAGKYHLDAPVSIAPVIASFDRLLFPNRDRLARYAAAGLIDAESPQGALVGFPKVDCLVDGSLDRRAIEESLEIDPARPTVLYAPTWSPYSSLHAEGLDVIDALSRLPVNIVVKLHDRSLDPTARGSGAVDWRAELRRAARGRRVHVAQGADASPYLFAADALVTDHSSVGFEFMLLDRPVVVIDCPALLRKASVAPDKVRLLRSAAAVAVEPRAVAESVMRELADARRLSERRRAIADELFYAAGGATSRAVRCLYDLLAMTAPDAASEGAPALEAAMPSAAVFGTALSSYETRTTSHV
jgi:CDP-glycerol:poly(glycerophosphate) glycerophosphotransferase